MGLRKSRNTFLIVFCRFFGTNVFPYFERFFGVTWKVKILKSVSPCPKSFYILNWWSRLVVLDITRIEDLLQIWKKQYFDNFMEEEKFFHLCHLCHLESETSPRCFCESANCLLSLLKAKNWWKTFLCLREKHVTIASFVEPRLNNIFHWYAHWLIIFKHLFSPMPECFLFIFLEKRNLSSIYILQSKLFPLVNHLYVFERIMAPKRIHIEQLLKFFSMDTFAYSKQAIANDILTLTS